MWGFPSLMAPESQLDKYSRYRQIFKQLHFDMTRLPFYRPFFQTACLHLGYRDSKGHALPPDNDGELGIVFDYAQNEVVIDGNNMLELSLDSFYKLTAEQIELLEAHLSGEPGLYRIVDAQPELGQLTFEDLTRSGHQVVLTDIMMSACYSRLARPEDFMFIRPVQLSDFAMTSGFNCTFGGDQERAVLKLWDKYQGSVRFSQIARHHQAKGIPSLNL